MSQIAVATTDPTVAMDVMHPAEDTNGDTFTRFLCINRPPPAISPRILGFSPRLPSALPPSASPRCVEPVTPDKQQPVIPFYSNDDSIDLQRPSESEPRDRSRRVMRPPVPSPAAQPALSPDPLAMYKSPHLENLSIMFDSPSASTAAIKREFPPSDSPQIALAPLRPHSFSADPFARPSPSALKPPAGPSVQHQTQPPLSRDFFREQFVSPRPDDPTIFDNLRSNSSAITTSNSANNLTPLHSTTTLNSTSKCETVLPELPSLAIPTSDSCHPIAPSAMSTQTLARPPRPPTFATSSPPPPFGITPPIPVTTGVAPFVSASIPTNTVVAPPRENSEVSMQLMRRPSMSRIRSSMASMYDDSTLKMTGMSDGDEQAMEVTPPSPPPGDRAEALSLTPPSQSLSPSESPSRVGPKTQTVSQPLSLSQVGVGSHGTLGSNGASGLPSGHTIGHSMAMNLSQSKSEDPLECQTCHHKFARRSNLYKHLRSVHQDERKFPCDRCTQKFKRRDHLLKHVRSVHSKEKKYTCQICGVGFAEKFNRDKHTRSIHNTERPFRCPCGAYFQDRDRMVNCLRCRSARNA